MSQINVGIIGFGTVGAGTFEVLTTNREIITNRVGAEVVVKRIADIVASGPFPQYFSLDCRFGVFGRGDMIDNGLDFGRIKHAVFTPLNQIVDGYRSRNFVAEYAIEPQNMHITGGVVDVMRIKYFLCDRFAHGAPLNHFQAWWYFNTLSSKS